MYKNLYTYDMFPTDISLAMEAGKTGMEIGRATQVWLMRAS
jgi:hypothetical protein